MCSMYFMIVKSNLLRVNRQIGQTYVMYIVGGQCSFWPLSIAQIFEWSMLQQLSFLHPAAKHVHILELQCVTQEMWIAGCRLPKPWLPGLSGFILFFSSPVSWIKNGAMAGQILTDMRRKILLSHILLTLHKSWQLPIPLVYRWLFFKINSQVFIQGEMNSIHNIFSNDYLWGPCLDSSSVFFSMPLPGTILFHLNFLCFLVFYRCWGSAENGRRFSSPHGPQYGDRSDPCSGKLCSFCWSWKWQNIKKTVER